MTAAVLSFREFLARYLKDFGEPSRGLPACTVPGVFPRWERESAYFEKQIDDAAQDFLTGGDDPMPPQTLAAPATSGSPESTRLCQKCLKGRRVTTNMTPLRTTASCTGWTTRPPPTKAKKHRKRQREDLRPQEETPTNQEDNELDVTFEDPLKQIFGITSRSTGASSPRRTPVRPPAALTPPPLTSPRGGSPAPSSSSRPASRQLRRVQVQRGKPQPLNSLRLHPNSDVFEDNFDMDMPSEEVTGENPDNDSTQTSGMAPPSPVGPPPQLSAQQKARLQALLKQRDEYGRAPFGLDEFNTDAEMWAAYRRSQKASYREYRKRERVAGTWTKDQQRGGHPKGQRTLATSSTTPTSR